MSRSWQLRLEAALALIGLALGISGGSLLKPNLCWIGGTLFGVGGALLARDSSPLWLD
jgi:hypothetical protein